MSNAHTTAVDIKFLDPCIASSDMRPAYATPGSAAFDLRAAIDEPITLEPGGSAMVSSGVSIHIKAPGLVGMIVPRSGLGAKHGIVIGNGQGVIDSDYTGPWMMCLYNRGSAPYVIQPLDRVAQALIVPVVQVSFNEVQAHSTTERGAGGFGSTGAR